LNDGRILGQGGLADLDAPGVALGRDDLLLFADLLLFQLVLLGGDVLQGDLLLFQGPGISGP
jgi:hypothetical protein